MSDFLGNLIARSTGAAEGIRPYLPARFEPVAPAEPGLSEVSEERVMATTMKASVPSGPAAPDERAWAASVAPVPAPREERRSEFIGESLDPARERHLRTGPDLQASRPTAEARRIDPVAVERVVDRPVMVERLIASAGEPLRSSQPEPVLRTSELRIPDAPKVKHLEPPRSNTLLIAEPRVDPPVFGEPPRTTIALRETGDSLEPSAMARGLSSERILSAQSRRAAVGRQPQSAKNATARTDPDIHVTIGRVEVRAMTAAQAPGPRRNAPQPMSLDEYQRTRTSGVQR